MRRHLELCLDCRACETACPSGVHYGRLIEPFRLAVKQADRRPEERFDWFRELILFRLFPYAERMHKLLVPIRFMQRTGLFDLAERMGMLEADSRPVGADGSAVAAAGQDWAEAAEVSAGRGAQAGAGGVFRRLRGRRHVSAHPLGHGCECCSRTAATCSFRPSRAAAGQSIFTPATAAAPGGWPTPTSWPSSSTATTRLW